MELKDIQKVSKANNTKIQIRVYATKELEEFLIKWNVNKNKLIEDCMVFTFKKYLNTSDTKLEQTYPFSIFQKKNDFQFYVSVDKNLYNTFSYLCKDLKVKKNKFLSNLLACYLYDNGNLI